MAEPLQPKQRVAGAKPDASSLVLASKSAARRQMLLEAGVPVVVDSAGIDEESVKAGLRAEGATPHEVAEVLAELKATRISPRHPGALVLGADQMLECEGKWFDKPADAAGAAAHLKALSGQSHRLIASAVIVKDGTRIWHQVDSAELTMRPLSDAFIAAYLDAVGDDALHSVGAYQLEGLGAQLFTRVRGDYFTVLGLPLLPLLEFLRTHGVIAR
jgi:septum formation protein